MLFYEPKEEQRMGVKRVRMAAEAGANVIVTACPFCMVNIEDAIKVAGMEGKMTAIDLTELVDRQMIRAVRTSGNPCTEEVEHGNSGLRKKSARHFGKRDRTQQRGKRYRTRRPGLFGERTGQLRGRRGPADRRPGRAASVTVVTVGGDEDEEILRREMAMGANQAC